MATLSSLLSYTAIIGPAGPAGDDGVDGFGITGPSGNYIVLETDIHLTGNYTITSGKNAITAGPIIVDDGFAMTVPDDSTWTVV